jgi:hypothetical protein
MTKPKRYIWRFTFIDTDGKVVATAEAGSKEFSRLQDSQSHLVSSAVLLDTGLASTSQSHIIHQVPLEPSTVLRVFTRVEHSLTDSTVSRMPAFSYRELDKTVTNYCFAYRERVIYTGSRNFHTVDLSSLES